MKKKIMLIIAVIAVLGGTLSVSAASENAGGISPGEQFQQKLWTTSAKGANW